MAHDRGVAFGGRQHVLDAVVNHLYGSARLPRQERRVTRDVRRIFLLAAESAACLRLYDSDSMGRQTKQHGQRPVHVVRALQRSVDGHAIVLGHGNHAVGLDVELLLVPRAVLAFDHDVGSRKSIGDDALVDCNRLEAPVRSLGIEERRLRGVVDRHTRCQQALAIFMGEQQNGLGDVIDLVLSQARLVVVDERNDVASWDVAIIDNGKGRGIEVEANTVQPPPRNRGPDGPAVEHSWEGKVVDIFRGAGDFGVRVLPPNVLPHRTWHLTTLTDRPRYARPGRQAGLRAESRASRGKPRRCW